jgi:ATP-dependent DNA ligase
MDLSTMQPTMLELARLPDALVGTDLVCERKWDGHRLTIISAGGRLDARNRHGRPYAARPVPEPVRRTLAATADEVPVWLDGELLDDRYVVFDLRAAAGRDLQSAAWTERRGQLLALAQRCGWGYDGEGPVSVTTSVTGDQDRVKLASSLLLQGAEGVVLKDPASRYRPGRAVTWRKAKFTRVMYAVAGSATERGNVAVRLRDSDGTWLTCGHAVSFRRAPEPGTVMQVRYRLTGAGRLREAVVIGLGEPGDVVRCELAQLHDWPHLAPVAPAP